LLDHKYLDRRVSAALSDSIEYWNKVLNTKVLLSTDTPLPHQISKLVFITQEETDDEYQVCGRTITNYNRIDGCVYNATIIIYTGCLGDINNIEDNARIISIVRHEIGHLLGLGHTEVVTDLMYVRPWPIKHPAVASQDAINLLNTYYSK